MNQVTNFPPTVVVSEVAKLASEYELILKQAKRVPELEKLIHGLNSKLQAAQATEKQLEEEIAKLNEQLEGYRSGDGAEAIVPLEGGRKIPVACEAREPRGGGRAE